jgi:hypothetical protein
MSPFQADGDWLRCALHAHTTNSDGEASPRELVALYEGLGFDVLAITDHWVRTVEPSTDSLLVIPGAELNASAGGPDEDAHVLAIGIETDPVVPEYTFEPLGEVVQWIAANGGVPYLAHTYWSGLRTEQWEDCEGLFGIEVYNAGCDLELGRGDSGLQWDEALSRGRRLHGLAADDSHHPGRDSGHAWTWVRSAERTQTAVLEALRAGSFYGSCGPEIHSVEVDDTSVWVRCSPVASATLFSGRKTGSRANVGPYQHRSEILDRENGGVTAVRLERPWDAAYGRVELADAQGRKAWTNTLWA